MIPGVAKGGESATWWMSRCVSSSKGRGVQDDMSHSQYLLQSLMAMLGTIYSGLYQTTRGTLYVYC